MEARGRMVNKQQVATTRWVNKNTTEPRYASDDTFCTLTNGVDTGMKSKRATWNDVVTAKRKDVSVSDGEDPFAGMNSLVDYQQEIERLKTLVPKVDKKRVSGSTKSNKNMSLPQQQQQRSNMWYDSLPVSTRSKPRSPSVGPSSEPTLSQTSSIASDDEGNLEPEDHGKPTESITEEEKARFLAFMRKWTGGCGWQAWDHTTPSTTPCTTTTTTTTTTTIITEPTSLWTESAPWECISTKPSHFNHTNSFFDSYSQQHYPTTHPLSPSFYQQHHHHQQQHHYPSSYNNHPQPVGAVGQRYQYHGPSPTSTRHRGPPFGVFVI
ncbi:hypothetical protein K492DRAFT_207098 [Lichtheimia hyalospora FSU 10163]|nr:hypothetical protein K492DRAFT_207098 [Lichtheimia hyalospora FSU 10163]